MLNKEDMMNKLRAAIAAVKSLPLEERHSSNHAALHLGVGREAMGLLGARYKSGSIKQVIDSLAVSAASSGGIVLVRPDERGTPVAGTPLAPLLTVAEAVLALKTEMPAVHLGTTNAGAQLLADAGGVLGSGQARHRVGLRYRGIDFLAWLDWNDASAAIAIQDQLHVCPLCAHKAPRMVADHCRAARAAGASIDVQRMALLHDASETSSKPPALDADLSPGIWSRVRGTADHVCPHGVSGGRCCPLPPRDAVTPHEGLRLEVRGDQLRVEADHGDGRRIYRLWQLEDGVLPTAELRLTEALAVQQLAQIAPTGGDPPLGWRHCAGDEELVTEARRAAVATLDPTWRRVEDGAWLLNGLPLGLSAAVHPPDDGVFKYRWEVGVGYDDLAGDEAETLVQAQLCAEAAVLRLVDEAGGALRERHERRRRVTETVQAAPIPEVP